MKTAVVLFCSILFSGLIPTSLHASPIGSLILQPPEYLPTSSSIELRGYSPYVMRTAPAEVQRQWHDSYRTSHSNLNRFLAALEASYIRVQQRVIAGEYRMSVMLSENADFLFNGMYQSTLQEIKNDIESAKKKIERFQKELKETQEKVAAFSSRQKSASAQYKKTHEKLEALQGQAVACSSEFFEVSKNIKSLEGMTGDLVLSPQLREAIMTAADELEKTVESVEVKISLLQAMVDRGQEDQNRFHSEMQSFQQCSDRTQVQTQNQWSEIQRINQWVEQDRKEVVKLEQELSQKRSEREILKRKSEQSGLNRFQIDAIHGDITKVEQQVSSLESRRRTVISANIVRSMQIKNQTGGIDPALMSWHQSQFSLLQRMKEMSEKMTKDESTLSTLQSTMNADAQDWERVCLQARKITKDLDEAGVLKTIVFEKRLEEQMKSLDKDENGIITDQSHFDFKPESSEEDYQGKNIRYLANRQIMLSEWQEQEPMRFHLDLLLLSGEFLRELDYSVSKGVFDEIESFSSAQTVLFIQNAAANITSIGVSLIPVIGQTKDLIDIYRGKDSITGETLSRADQIFLAVGVMMPVGGSAIAHLMMKSEQFALRVAPGILKDAQWIRGTYESLERYGPMKVGPLENVFVGGSKVANTFRSSSYDRVITSGELKLYRVYDLERRELGAYWSRLSPTGSGQAMLDLALDPQYNKATHWVEITVPRGTEFFEGAAASMERLTSNRYSAGTLLGGGNQIFINDKIPLQWVTKRGAF